MFSHKDFLLFRRVFLLWMKFSIFILFTMRFSSFLGVSLLGLFLIPISSFALGANLEIGVSPPRHEFTIGTGKTIVREVMVFNNSSTDTYTVKLSA